jgi:GT2 family glycosyltransferase
MYAGTNNLQRARDVATDMPTAIPPTSPGLVVAVLTLDRPDLMLPLLEVLATGPQVFAEAGLDFHVVVGDTGSTDPTVLAAYTREEPWLTVTADLAYHFSACNNQVVAGAPSLDRIMLLNNDVKLPNVSVLLAMAREFDANERLGVVGLRLDFPDGTVQHNGIEFFTDGPHAYLPFHPYGGQEVAHSAGRSRDVLAVTGAALMARADVWQRLGGLDERFHREGQDVDFCLAARRLGTTVRVLDAGPVVHLESATRGPEDHDPEDRALLQRRWRSFLRAEFR